MDKKDDGIKVHAKKGRIYDKGFPQWSDKDRSFYSFIKHDIRKVSNSQAIKKFHYSVDIS